jgi:hypothetical protein
MLITQSPFAYGKKSWLRPQANPGKARYSCTYRFEKPQSARCIKITVSGESILSFDLKNAVEKPQRTQGRI